jgi:hypothetical protein
LIAVQKSPEAIGRFELETSRPSRFSAVTFCLADGGRKRVFCGASFAKQAGDGSFCSRTCFGEIPERSDLRVRARKDAKRCFRAAENSRLRRFYASEKFTPEQVRQDESRAWKTTKIFYGGKRRKIR